MTRSRWVLAGLLAATWLAAPAAAQEQGKKRPQPQEASTEIPNTWYAQALAHSDAGVNVTNFWSKGPLLRAETVVMGRRVTTIVNGSTYYAYDGLTRVGVAVGRAPGAIKQDATRGRPFGNELETILRQGAEFVGVESLGGSEVELFRITDERGRRQVWVTADELRLPVRLEVFRRRTGQTLTTDFLNWMSGIPISDAFFEPEPGIDFVRLTIEEYVEKQLAGEPPGPVPIFYTDLLNER